MKPIRITEEMANRFQKQGHWTQETFFDFWERNAREYGNREALVDSKYRMTWAEAKEHIDAMAMTWINMGLPKSARVIVQSPNSVYGFLARIACERAGLICLTVYPYLRERELEYMVERTEASAVVAPHIYRNFNYLEIYAGLQKRFSHLKYIFLFDEQVPDSAPANSYSIIKLTQEALGKKIDETALKERRFDTIWEVGLLTSTTGTTGLPKLVEWPIAPRICTAKARIDIWNLNKDDITMAVAPHAGGAAGTLTYFAAPLAAAKTVMLEDFSAEEALKLIDQEKATAIGVVPTHLVRMLEQDVSKYDTSSLRFIRSAGGYLSPKLGQEAEQIFDAVITSDLGTQDVGSIAGCRVDDPPEVRRRTVGAPLTGNEVKLLDEKDGKEVPQGEVGVLYFRGPHSPAGYFRDEEKTYTVFDKEGWTTTEDLVRYEQGCLWIMGRIKDMIIRGGQNIYPAEIEGILNEHPKVGSVAIVGYPDKEMGERACAYIVPKSDQELSFDEMTQFLLEKKLAKYKLPERLEIVNELPVVGDTGKVDKKVLKKDIEEKVGATA